MRLTSDVILQAQVCINPLRERELSLRGTLDSQSSTTQSINITRHLGYKAPAIENLGVTKVSQINDPSPSLLNTCTIFRLGRIRLHRSLWQWDKKAREFPTFQTIANVINAHQSYFQDPATLGGIDWKSPSVNTHQQQNCQFDRNRFPYWISKVRYPFTIAFVHCIHNHRPQFLNLFVCAYILLYYWGIQSPNANSIGSMSSTSYHNCEYWTMQRSDQR